MKSGEEIWQEMHPARQAALDPAWRAARALHDSWAARSAEIQKFADHLNGFWTGDAAQSARSGAARLAAKYLADADETAGLHDAVHRQYEAVGAVAKAVVPVPPKPGVADLVSCFAGQAPGAPARAVQLQRAYDDAVNRNVLAYQAYVAASEVNAAAMPRFGEPGGSGATMLTADHRLADRSPGAQAPEVAAPGGQPPGVPAGGTGAGVAAIPDGGDPADPAGGAQPGQAPATQTDTSGYDSGGHSGGHDSGGHGFGGAAQPGAERPAAGAVVGAQAQATGGTPAGTVPSAVAPTGGGAPQGGGAPMGGVPPMGGGGMGGFGAGGTERPGSRYDAGTGGGRPSSGYRYGDDPEEGYLVTDEDGDAIVGELPRTAPPVIGE